MGNLNECCKESQYQIDGTPKNSNRLTKRSTSYDTLFPESKQSSPENQMPVSNMQFREQLPNDINGRDSDPQLNLNLQQLENRSNRSISLKDKGKNQMEERRPTTSKSSKRVSIVDKLNLTRVHRSSKASKSSKGKRSNGSKENINIGNINMPTTDWQNRRSQKSKQSCDSSKAEDRDKLMDLGEPESQLKRLRTYQSIAKNINKRIKKNNNGKGGSTGRGSRGQSFSGSEVSYNVDSNGDKIIEIDDLDSESGDLDQLSPAAKMPTYKKIQINSMSNLSHQSQGPKKQTIDMFSSNDNSASDFQTSGQNTSRQLDCNAEGGNYSNRLGSVITPRYMQDSTNPFDKMKQVIDDQSSKVEDIKDSGSYIDDQMSKDLRDKSMKVEEEVISIKSQTLNQKKVESIDREQNSKSGIGHVTEESEQDTMIFQPNIDSGLSPRSRGQSQKQINGSKPQKFDEKKKSKYFSAKRKNSEIFNKDGATDSNKMNVQSPKFKQRHTTKQNQNPQFA